MVGDVEHGSLRLGNQLQFHRFFTCRCRQEEIKLVIWRSCQSDGVCKIHMHLVLAKLLKYVPKSNLNNTQDILFVFGLKIGQHFNFTLSIHLFETWFIVNIELNTYIIQSNYIISRFLGCGLNTSGNIVYIYIYIFNLILAGK